MDQRVVITICLYSVKVLLSQLFDTWKITLVCEDQATLAQLLFPEEVLKALNFLWYRR